MGAETRWCDRHAQELNYVPCVGYLNVLLGQIQSMVDRNTYLSLHMGS